MKTKKCLAHHRQKMVNANNNTYLKTSNSEISDSLLIAQQRSWHKFWYLYLDIYIFPLEKKKTKKHCKQLPNSLRNCLLLDSLPPEFLLPFMGDYGCFLELHIVGREMTHVQLNNASDFNKSIWKSLTGREGTTK